MSKRVPVWKRVDTSWARLKRSPVLRKGRRWLPILGTIIVAVSLLQKHATDDSSHRMREWAEHDRQRVMEIQGENRTLIELRADIRAISVKVGADTSKSPFRSKAPLYDFIETSLNRVSKINSDYTAVMSEIGISSSRAHELNNEAAARIDTVRDILEPTAQNPKLFTDVMILKLRGTLSAIDDMLRTARNEMSAELDRKIQRTLRFENRIDLFWELFIAFGFMLSWLGKEPEEVDHQLQE